MNGFTILLVLSIMMKNYVASSKKKTEHSKQFKTGVQKPYQYETKMTKIDTLFLTKMSLKNHTL